jgi:uncharacterized protein YbgA (DUF1722 family)
VEQILNLKNLGGIDDLRPFFGEIQAIKEGKYYHLIGDIHLNQTEFARFTKKPRFSSMGAVIYAGINRICKLTQKMPSDFAVRLLQPNPQSGVVNIEIIHGRVAVLAPDTLVPAIWIQYNLRAPKFVKFSLLLYRIQCANGQMVLFDGFINEKLPSDDINHIHHQWSPCFYNSLFDAYDDALVVMKEQAMDQNRMAQTLMTVFGIGRRESISDQRNFGPQQDHYAISLDRILAYHIEKYGANANALLQAASYFASHVEPEIHQNLSDAQRFDQLSKYREKRMIQVGRLMAKLEKNSRKHQPSKQLRNREWEELFDLNSK